ncbi:MAG: hypothetical protein QME74_05415 [Candidatus Edwardsbacteria bacterium]|nr:hypothetical protein [Candidatus Edwardsbacteria bacterium]
MTTLTVASLKTLRLSVDKTLPAVSAAEAPSTDAAGIQRWTPVRHGGCRPTRRTRRWPATPACLR